MSEPFLQGSHPYFLHNITKHWETDALILLSHPLKSLAGTLNWRWWLISLIISSSLRYAICHPFRLTLHLITVFWYECMSRHLQYRKSRQVSIRSICVLPYFIWGSHSGLTGDSSVLGCYTLSICNYLTINTAYHPRGRGFVPLILLTAFLCPLLLVALQLCEFWPPQQFSSMLLCP